MRIVQVDSARTFGGGEKHALELAEALRFRGHDVSLAGPWDSPIQPDIKLPFLNALDLYTAFRLRRLVAQKPFDIIHAHRARDYPVVAAALWGLKRPKLVLTRHLLYPLKTHILYRRVDGWIATTPQILTTLDRCRPRESTVIPNWVDTRKFAYCPHALNNPVTVGILGQISPHKGHDDALDALRTLGNGYRLLIGGHGKTGTVERLRRRAATLPVEFHGFVELPAFFQKIDILVVPSWEEPFGIVLLEAMASGVPVIATDAGGPQLVLKSGSTGLLVPPRNARSLADAIRLLAADATLRSTLVRQARIHVEELYDTSRVVPKVEEFYKRLIGSSAH